MEFNFTADYAYEVATTPPPHTYGTHWEPRHGYPNASEWARLDKSSINHLVNILGSEEEGDKYMRLSHYDFYTCAYRLQCRVLTYKLTRVHECGVIQFSHTRDRYPDKP